MPPSGEVSSIAGIPISELALFVSLATTAFNELRSDQRVSVDRRAKAEVALSNAFNATEGYYTELEQGRAKNAKMEHEIAALWDEAATHFLHVNRKLANRLGLKSEFWRTGAAWSNDEIAAKKISLETVRRDGYSSTR